MGLHLGWDEASISDYRLENYSGNFSFVLLKEALNSRNVIVRCGQSIDSSCLELPGVRETEGGNATACFNKKWISMTMVTTLKFDDLRTASESTSQP
ncbi:hypothetical protein H5410_020003 [Solanum commersonii]|uniref:Uncharacterized protein n=1 Tax=Solanum commersonii TaxID=4109 RepID=A0A9J5Z7V8_SOLCO|nr:hypothetical protein H5410_020003 [Solanum commersonii]